MAQKVSSERAPSRGLENLEVSPGDTVWQLGDGTVLQASHGKLKLCKCVTWHWECEQIGDTWRCLQICSGWSCEEIPAAL